MCYNNIESGNDAKYLKEKNSCWKEEWNVYWKTGGNSRIHRNCQRLSELSRKDRLAADCLFQQRLYNEAAYFYIQSMEKRVKAFICKKIDVSKSYYADMLRGTGHSLENSIEILITVYCGNDAVLRQQLETMLMEGVLKQTRFERLNNVLRYPNYNPGKKCYTMIEANYKDCEALKQMADQLQKMLDDIWKRVI